MRLRAYYALGRVDSTQCPSLLFLVSEQYLTTSRSISHRSVQRSKAGLYLVRVSTVVCLKSAVNDSTFEAAVVGKIPVRRDLTAITYHFVF